MSLLLNNKRKKIISTSSDPYFNNVVLYLKGDGVNNSTNIVDSSPNPKTITVNGTAKISTAQSKYGGSSLYFDGSSNCLIYTNNTSDLTLGTSNFTLEMWLYPFTAQPFIMEWRTNNSFGTGNPAWANFGGTFAWWIQNIGIYGLTNFTNLQTWRHIALTRNGNNFTYYLNGVSTNTFTNSTNYTGNSIYIGTNNNNFSQMFIDSLRLTTGIVRYNSNFNPETDTYLNM